MLGWIEARTTPWSVVLLLVLAMTVYALMMTVTIPHVRSAGGGVEVFDLRPGGYDVATAREIVSRLSSDGIDYYRSVQIPLDFVYPLLLGLFGASALALARRAVAFPRWTLAVPLAVVLADYLENVGVLFMLRPEAGAVLIRLTSIATVAKSVLTTVSMTGVLAAMTLAAIRLYRTRRMSRNG